MKQKVRSGIEVTGPYENFRHGGQKNEMAWIYPGCASYQPDTCAMRQQQSNSRANYCQGYICSALIRCRKGRPGRAARRHHGQQWLAGPQ